jgi:hypothetical protein
MNKAIIVWRFEDAPLEYQRLSEEGGDEDWIVFIPDSLPGNLYISWLDRICSYGEPPYYKVEGGGIYIGSHA